MFIKTLQSYVFFQYPQLFFIVFFRQFPVTFCNALKTKQLHRINKS